MRFTNITAICVYLNNLIKTVVVVLTTWSIMRSVSVAYWETGEGRGEWKGRSETTRQLAGLDEPVDEREVKAWAFSWSLKRTLELLTSHHRVCVPPPRPRPYTRKGEFIFPGPLNPQRVLMLKSGISVGKSWLMWPLLPFFLSGKLERMMSEKREKWKDRNCLAENSCCTQQMIPSADMSHSAIHSSGIVTWTQPIRCN